MSIHAKLILPLINEKLSLDDISEKAGFAGIYTLDINRPGLTNHVFLLYKRTMEPESLKAREKISKFDNLHSKRMVKINNVLYALYCFTINRSIKLIKNNGMLILPKDDKVKVGKFWQFTDVDVTDYMLNYCYVGDKFKDVVVPEEDYSPSDFITYDEKRGELVVSSSL